MEKTRKRSKKRDAILACIRSTRRHPSAEWIYDRLKPEIPDLSRGTVYRNLRLFLEEGVVASVGVVGGLERFDGDVSPHAHFICQCCGEVIDLPGLAAALIHGKTPSSPPGGAAPASKPRRFSPIIAPFRDFCAILCGFFLTV